MITQSNNWTELLLLNFGEPVLKRDLAVVRLYTFILFSVKLIDVYVRVYERKKEKKKYGWWVGFWCWLFNTKSCYTGSLA